MHLKLAATVLCFLAMYNRFAFAAIPEELAQSRAWSAAKFEDPQPQPVQPGLLVLANYDAVQKNARHGQSLKIGATHYQRGLYCHAFSKIMVRLPAPGRNFSALVGVDSNAQTSNGRGSVDFSVTVNRLEKFRSGVMREGMTGKAVAVALDGATEFVLQVDETPDGIASDQADWAEAKVTLQDGRELWLADLPLREAAEQAMLSNDPPFSFTYDGKPSTEFLQGWKLERSAKPLDAQRTERTLTYTDPRTQLQLRCVAVEYHDFPTVEWTVHFKNNGAIDTPIIENIQGLDIRVSRNPRGEFLLHHNVGSPGNGSDYAPLETPLLPDVKKRIGASGGRPTNSDWSYFNLEWQGKGLIAVVGWPGQWAAEWSRDKAQGLRIQAGQELTHFKLLPGEEVRGPLMVLQFWQGDWIRAQNIWRRWMMAHSMPKIGGKLPPPLFLGTSGRQLAEMIQANEANQIEFINRYLKEDLKIDYWWMDAGWYVQQQGWPQVGTWEVDAKRFPRGLRAISDHAHRKDIKTLLWFEPERVAPNTWLSKNHPEWILGGEKGGLLNLGNPKAWQWVVERIDGIINEQGIDLYRQDFNMDPLPLWRANDAPDRQGITEIKHVTGYLAFWDELRRRHPNMLIDACASGGRRNDLESLRRAVPLWRSDYAYEPIGHQGMTHGISLWIPYHGTGTVASREAGYYGGGATAVEPYAFWSNAAPSLVSTFDVRVKNLDYAALRRLFKDWRSLSPNYYGDFYPLTPNSSDETVWVGWQFHRPEAGQGMIQMFRRGNSLYESARLKLHGLNPATRYRLTNIESTTSVEMSGAQLLKNGFTVTIKEQPGVANIAYKSLNTAK